MVKLLVTLETLCSVGINKPLCYVTNALTFLNTHCALFLSLSLTKNTKNKIHVDFLGQVRSEHIKHL